MLIRLDSQKDKESFQNLLRGNIVKFTYKKKDGTIRYARGSLSKKYVSEYFKKQTDEKKKKYKKGNNAKPEQITYWDLISDNWRSPRLIGQTIEVLEIKPVDEPLGMPKKIEERIQDVNTQLVNIYDMRENLKLEKKALKKEFDSIKWSIDKHLENADKSIRIYDRLEKIKEERKFLRVSVKKLKRYKENLEKSKKIC